MKASVNLVSCKVYKNSNFIIKDGEFDATPFTEKYEYFLGNLSDLDLSLFREMYLDNDTNRERPIYGYSFFYTRSSGPNPDLQIDLGGKDLQFPLTSTLEDTVGLDTLADSSNQNTSNKYGYAPPFTTSNNRQSYGYGFTGYMTDTTSSPSSRVNPILNNIFKNANMHYITPKYLEEEDCMKCPGFLNGTVSLLGKNFSQKSFMCIGKDEKSIMHFDNFKQTWATFQSLGGKDINVAFNDFGKMHIIREGMQDISFVLPDIEFLSGRHGDYGHWYFIPTFPLFFKDGTGEYWIMVIGATRAGSAEEGANVYLTKVKNLFKSISKITVPSTTEEGKIYANATWYTDEELGAIDRFFDAIFDPQIIEDGYDDGAPDISGPGDPYQDIDNVDDIVGGQDINLDKDINVTDDTYAPNTSYDRFAMATGMFGSYVLEVPDLQAYTKTLTELYAHSVDILSGEACATMANRIRESTTSLIMLPLEIPTEDYSSTVFALGNTGIMGPGTWNQYIWGQNWATANYLNKFTKTYTINLGTINHNYDNFLDFAPYTTASLFIPYIGKVELPINLIQSTTNDQRPLTLQIRVNYTNGDLIAMLFCEIEGRKVALSHWNGNCSRPIKIAINDDSEAIRAGTNRIVSMFTMSAGLGSTQSLSGGTSTSESLIGGDNVSYNATNSASQSQTSSKSFSVKPPAIPSSVSTSQHMIGSGSVSGDLGYLGAQKIILTVERPIWWRPYDYGDLVGYPTKKIAKLGSIKGFAKITEAHIRCSATNDEKEEIASLLSEGAIF